MLENLLQGVSLGSFLFLAVACFMASFIDAISGGGGLISLPAYLASGLPYHVALGTNKSSACLGAIASSIKFAKSGKVNWELMKKIAPFSFVGAFLGVNTVLRINPNFLAPLIIILLILVLIYTLFNKKAGEVDNFTGLTKDTIIKGIFVALFLGFYDGFFGPGTGSFLIFALIKVFKFDFTKASGNTKILNLISNLTSASVYIFSGKVHIFYAVTISFITILGGTCGAKMAVTKGAKFIRPLFITMTTIILSKMVAETFFGINVVGIIQESFSKIL